VKKPTLFILAAVVLLGVSIWVALDAVIRSVLAPTAPEEALEPVIGTVRTDATVWLTSTSLEDCAVVKDSRARDEDRRVNDLVRPGTDSGQQKQEEEPCAPFELGKVGPGTKVEILGECGVMSKVRISSGRLLGREGCIEKDRLDAGGAAR
jgi:hypothetical protein